MTGHSSAIFFVVGVSIVGLNLRKSFFSYLERFRRKLHICGKSDSDICWPLTKVSLIATSVLQILVLLD